MRRGCRPQERDGGGHDEVDEEHHPLPGPAVGEPPHQEAPRDAPDENEGDELRHPGLGHAPVHREEELQVLGRAAHRPDRGHAAEGEEVEGGLPQDVQDRVTHRRAGFRRGGTRRPRLPLRPLRLRLADEEGEREGDRDHEDADHLQRRAPAQGLGEGVGEERDEGAAHADAEVGDPHGPAAPGVEPAGQHHLVRQRPAGDVAERVHQVERVEGDERRRAAEADRGEPGEEDADEHQPPGTEAVHEDAGEEPEERSDHQLGEGVARGDLRPAPAQLLHEEVVEEGQAVEGEAHDREEREEGGGDGQRLVPLAGAVEGASPGGRRPSRSS